MFIPDETHKKLDPAQFGLMSATDALLEGAWAASKLNLLLAALDTLDPADVLEVVKGLQRSADRIRAMKSATEKGELAVSAARAALAHAKEKIPNTTLPDLDGLESLKAG